LRKRGSRRCSDCATAAQRQLEPAASGGSLSVRRLLNESGRRTTMSPSGLDSVAALVVTDVTARRSARHSILASIDVDRGPAAAPARRPERVTTPVLALALGDITGDLADAIVNPAGGGLVDLAVRRAAGPFIMEELHRGMFDRGRSKLAAGEAIVTGGYGLAAPHVIHCGPPVYADGPEQARQALISCHVEALRLARARGLASVAFPAIGTGIYRYPAREAAAVAVRAVVTELRAHAGPRVVRFVFSDEGLLRLYASAASAFVTDDPIRSEGGIAFRL
jgi:O-acetyl-ADP-ribose deacetylase (regulator of RNase III)